MFVGDGMAACQLPHIYIYIYIYIYIIKTVFKKPSSLRSMLFNQKEIVLSSNSGGLSTRCTSMEVAQHKQGPKCLTCPMMSNTHNFNTNGMSCECMGGNCKSYNIIYFAQCKVCSKGYFGKTTQPLHKRFNGHRNSIDPKKMPTMITDEHSLSAHALIDHQNCKPFGELYSLNVVKFCKPQDLLKTEQFYTNKYNTHRPGGLNIDNPIGLSMLRLGRPVVMS